jgi:hypothetical protein
MFMLLSILTELIWPRICGAGLIVVALVWARRRRIDAGLEGEPPSFAITGCAAVGVAVITAAFGLVMMLWPELLFSDRACESAALLHPARCEIHSQMVW